FSHEKMERRFRPDIAPVKLRNPMNEDESVLRTSLVPGILKTIRWNQNRGNRDLQLYELSKVYSQDGERRSLVLGATGALRAPAVHQREQEFGFYDLKGDVEEVLTAFDDRMETGPFPAGKYSLSISVLYQSRERTLTDVEVEAFDRKLLQVLEQRLGARLRR